MNGPSNALCLWHVGGFSKVGMARVFTGHNRYAPPKYFAVGPACYIRFLTVSLIMPWRNNIMALDNEQELKSCSAMVSSVLS